MGLPYAGCTGEGRVVVTVTGGGIWLGGVGHGYFAIRFGDVGRGGQVSVVEMDTRTSPCP